MHAILRGKTKLIDLVEIEPQQNPEEKFYIFLFFVIGFAADAGVGSEYMRCIGKARYSLYGALRIMQLN